MTLTPVRQTALTIYDTCRFDGARFSGSQMSGEGVSYVLCTRLDLSIGLQFRGLIKLIVPFNPQRRRQNQ